MADWKISRRQGACSECRRGFEDGESHHSALVVSGEEPQRRDYCRACWGRRDGRDEVFWWRTRHSAGKGRRFALDVEALEALFLGLEGRAERPLRELRYVLCLLLMRKRRLKVERIARGEEGESFVVRRPRRREAMEVGVFDFTAERMGELREALGRLLEGAEPDAAVSAPPGGGEGEGGPA